MAVFYVVAAFMIGGAFGALIMALFASKSYEKGWKDGYDDSVRDDEWLARLFGSNEE